MAHYRYEPVLVHHGIKGMRWGIRRYRNEDGSLTPAGKKHYSETDPNKLQKELNKQIRKERHRQGKPRYYWRETIGENSKLALDKELKDSRDLQKEPELKALQRKLQALDKLEERTDMSPDEYDEKYNKIWDDYYKTDTGKRHKALQSWQTNSGDGWKMGKEYVESYGKNLTLAYLKDLGYDKTGAEFIAQRLSEDLRVIGR